MTLEEFKVLNKSKGFHWFEQSTMRFFKSCVTNWDCITGYFISSEQGPSGFRRYSIRRGDFNTGNVDTIGEFQKYKTLAAAKSALRRLI